MAIRNTRWLREWSGHRTFRPVRDHEPGYRFYDMPTKPEQQPRRVAFMLDLRWPHKRHADMFAGAQRYAEEQGWESTIDEFVAERLATLTPKTNPYDGVIGRLGRKMVEQANRLKLPVVNVWVSSPVWQEVSSVIADCAAVGRLRAEHLLARGLRRFAAFTNDARGAKIDSNAFRDTIRDAGYACSIVNVPIDPRRSYQMWQQFEQRVEDCMQE